ncbi:MAG: restriction endonuclease subunit S, partial [Parvularcula sp.]|nr:restriction endonuclease subunit S [Parvularcula sp.]
IYPKNTDELLPEFLFWNLEGRYEEIRRLTGDGGNDRRGLNMPLLRGIDIPLPPLEEQKRIVAVLDQAFAALDRARAHAEANQADLDDLTLSSSRKTFDGLEAEWRPLGSLCEIYQPKTISAKEMSPDGKYVVFGANGKIGRHHAYNHAEPQLLVTCRGATCGQINISEPFSWITGNAMVVRPKGTEITSDFLEHFFRDAVDWNEVITGAAQPQITRQSLSPMLVPVPAITEQDAASERLGALREQVEKLRSEYQIKLDAIADLRQSLLQKAFSGGL